MMEGFSMKMLEDPSFKYCIKVCEEGFMSTTSGARNTQPKLNGARKGKTLTTKISVTFTSRSE